MDLIKQETEKRKERNIRYLFILTVSVVDQLIFIFTGTHVLMLSPL